MSADPPVCQGAFYSVILSPLIVTKWRIVWYAWLPLPQTDFDALIKISAVFRGGYGVLPVGWDGEHVSF